MKKPFVPKRKLNIPEKSVLHKDPLSAFYSQVETLMLEGNSQRRLDRMSPAMIELTALHHALDLFVSAGNEINDLPNEIANEIREFGEKAIYAR